MYDKARLANEEFGALYVHLKMGLPVCETGQVERLVGWLVVGLAKVHESINCPSYGGMFANEHGMHGEHHGNMKMV